MTDWYMRTEPLELKDGSTIKNYHYEFNSTDRVVAKIVEDVFKAIMDIKADRKTEPQTEKCPFDDPIPCEWVNCPNSSNCPYKTKDEPQTYITEDRDTQILDAWQVKLKAEQDEPQKNQ